MMTPKKKISLRRLATLAVLGLLVIGPAGEFAAAAAAELRAVEMKKQDGAYHIRAETWLNAAPETVFAIMLDYDEFHRLSRGLTSTKWLDEEQDGLPVAYSRLDSCVGFFCRKLEKVEVVQVTGPLSFATKVSPERSDFKEYSARWQFQPEKGGTLIRYEMEMQPAFWVPPLIGPWAIRRKAESSALEIAERIEFLTAEGMALEDFDLNAYLARQ